MKYELETKKGTVVYDLVRSNRKTVGLTVSRDGTVTVKAPNSVSLKLIEEIVAKKLEWIQRKQEELAMLPRETKKDYVTGQTILYLGESILLQVDTKHSKTYDFVQLEETGLQNVLHVYTKSAESYYVKELVYSWLMKRAGKIFEQRIQYYQPYFSVKPATLRIKDQKTRWGSCSTRRNINLNWRLIMAPMEVIDYVIIHEMCHLLQMNHSKEFWNEVEKVMPEYRNHQNWLKVHGNELHLD